MDIVCSICSRAKDQDPRLLPAKRRYTGSHITKVEAIAKEGGRRFFILSGVHGLVSENEAIPYYDHLLTDEGVDELSERIRYQLGFCNITAILFFTKGKPNWQPYLRALTLACERATVHLEVKLLADDD